MTGSSWEWLAPVAQLLVSAGVEQAISMQIVVEVRVYLLPEGRVLPVPHISSHFKEYAPINMVVFGLKQVVYVTHENALGLFQHAVHLVRGQDLLTRLLEEITVVLDVGVTGEILLLMDVHYSFILVLAGGIQVLELIFLKAGNQASLVSFEHCLGKE